MREILVSLGMIEKEKLESSCKTIRDKIAATQQNITRFEGLKKDLEEEIEYKIARIGMLEKELYRAQENKNNV